MIQVNSWDELQTLFINYRLGDSAQTIILFESLSKKMNQYCSFKGSSKEAEDLSQQILLKIHLSRESFDENQSFKAWVYSIAQNTLIDRWKKRKEVLIRQNEDEDSLFDRLESGEPDLAELFQMRDSIEKIMNQLNPLEQKMVYLYGWEQLSIAELADVTGLSEAAVKVRIHRILKEVRNKS